MKRNPSDRTAVMIVRLWVEPNHPTATRVRIIQTLDTDQDEQSVAAASSADDICDAMKRWVEDFENPDARNGNGRDAPRVPTGR